MNEHIKEIAKRAGIEPATNSVGMPILVATNSGKLADPSEALETFAKLIIQECATIADGVYTMHVPPGPVIKQTFGIEE
jgi:hypothetical protein